MNDLLTGAVWSCAPGDPVSIGHDRAPVSGWVYATVPGTVAGALLDSDDDLALLRDYDRDEWWFRCEFPAPPQASTHVLRMEGLATLADVWLNGEHLLHSENMFLTHELELDALAAENHLLFRFAPVSVALAARRPRPRWRTARLTSQNLRWIRTTLLGRTSGRPALPAAVGPWRPVTLLPAERVVVGRRTVHASVGPDGTGTVVVEAQLRSGRLGGAVPAGPVAIRVHGPGSDVRTEVILEDRHLATTVTVPDVALWWPRGYGDQPLYDVTLELAGEAHRLARVGFRTVTVDRDDGAFTIVCNGVPVFARGTSWMPPDPVRLDVTPERLAHNVRLLADGGHTMVRIPGNTVYPEPALLDLLDEHGLLLWQDAMFAYVDVPEDPAFLESVSEELTQAFELLQGHPCLALVCGGADTEEQAEYSGAPAESWSSTVATRTIPELVERLLPGTAYLPSTPGGSPLPTASDRGVTHYFGVPGYLRPLQDVRRAGVRFAAECLPLATPSEPVWPGVEHLWQGLGTHPDPRHGVHKDSARVPWDLADCRDHYVRELFGEDPTLLRQQDAERAELLERATAVTLVEHSLAEWRRAGSPCSGALTFYGHDLLPGPGLGMVDVLDRPKSTWYAVRHLSAPVAVLLTDEGFSGLGVHLVNDTATTITGSVRLDAYGRGELLLESTTVAAVVPAHGGTSIDVSTAFGGFRDLTWAHRFGPPAADVIAVTLLDADGTELARAVHLPAGVCRTPVEDLGLAGRWEDGPTPRVLVSSVRFAQWVRLEAGGRRPEDSWFHLLPGEERSVALHPLPGLDEFPLSVVIAALNSRQTLTLRPAR